MPAMTGKFLIIGYGNTLRGDDGIGQAVAEALVNEAGIDRADVIACHQLTPDLAECIAAVDLVVFVDAAVNVPPGIVAVREVPGASALSQGGKIASLVHTADPAALLGLASRLYGRSPEAFLVTIGVSSLALSEALSDTVAASLPEAITAVRRLVAERMGDR